MEEEPPPVQAPRSKVTAHAEIRARTGVQLSDEREIRREIS